MTSSTTIAAGAGVRNRALIVAFLLAISYGLLLPVVPVIVEKQSGSGEAGAATAVLFGATVLAEVSAPILMARISSRSLVVTAMLLAGVLSPAYADSHIGLGPILVVTFFRGATFGLTAVICSALVSSVAVQSKRGTAMGSFGLVTTAPLIICPSIGLILLSAMHLEFDVALSASVPIFASIVALGLPRVTEMAPLFRLPRLGSRGARVGITFLCLTVVHLSYGGLISFVPIYLPASGAGSSAVFLFVAGVTRTLSRYLAGVIVDRYRASATVLAGTVLMVCGLALVPLSSAAFVLIFAAAAYGAGHGAVQTATYVSLLLHSDRSEIAIISAGWNMAVDFGIAGGAAILGVVAARYGVGAVLWILPLMVATALPIALVGARRDDPKNVAETLE